MFRTQLLWGVYFLFAGLALYLNWHEDMLRFEGPLGILKLGVWTALLCFLAYSIYCSSRENFFRSVGEIARLHWGRQVGIDLYLGLFLGLVVIYLNEGTFAVILWLLPLRDSL